MNRNSDKALTDVAHLLEVTREEAREYCARVQGLLTEKVPPTWAIALCLERVPEAHKFNENIVANRAQRIYREEVKDQQRQKQHMMKKDSQPESIPDAVTPFGRRTGQDQQQAFNSWLYANPRGYVLNLRSEDRAPMLHEATCKHLRALTEDERNFTHRPKYCCMSKSVLKTLARKKSEYLMERCHHCDP